MISVIIPVWNGEEGLRRCLDSVVDQTIFHQLDILVVDDGSTDSSGAIAETYAQSYENFRVLHTENRGVSAARNAGLQLTRGEYFTFVDADDYLAPDAMEKLLAAAGDTDIVRCGMLVEYPAHSVRRNTQSRRLDQCEAMRAFLMGEIDPCVAGKLFRTSTVEGIRFDERLHIAEDKDFLFRCLLKAKSFKELEYHGYHYVMSRDSICRSAFDEKRLDSLLVADRVAKQVEKFFPALKPAAESMAIDVKCRVYCDIHSHGAAGFEAQFQKLKKEIRGFSLITKWRYSNKKHFLAFMAARISPRLYIFLKRDLKLQYKG